MQAARVFDLAAHRADGGSGVLRAFKSWMQQQRRERELGREQQQAAAEFRRFGGSSRMMPPRIASASLPQPGFPRVSGQRAFAAAASSRLTSGWGAFATGINADLEGALAALVARSRDWAVNTDLGRRYVSLVQNNVPGATGPTLQVRAKNADGKLDEAANAAIEAAWSDWCSYGNCDVTGRMSFADVCRTVIACDARDGEHLVRKVRGRAYSYGFRLQVLDVDRIATNVAISQADRGNVVRLGVEINSLGRCVALHLMSAHPGDPGAGAAPSVITQRVPIDELLHGFIQERPEQVRGYPWAAAVLLSADQLATYKQYALVAAKVGAAKMGFYTTSVDAMKEGTDWDHLKDATGALVQDVEAGMLEALPPGVTFQSFDPDYPHQAFEPFVNGHERGVATGLNVAHHNLTGNMTGVNFSSARIAELGERSHWRGLQTWHIGTFVRPVYAEWLRMALVTQSIRLESGAPLPVERFDKFYAASEFQGRSWEWVDPKNDMEAAEFALRNDMRSLRQINDQQGVDTDAILVDKQSLIKRCQDLDIPLPGFLQPKAGAAAAPAPTNGGAA